MGELPLKVPDLRKLPGLTSMIFVKRLNPKERVRLPKITATGDVTLWIIHKNKKGDLK